MDLSQAVGDVMDDDDASSLALQSFSKLSQPTFGVGQIDSCLCAKDKVRRLAATTLRALRR